MSAEQKLRDYLRRTMIELDAARVKLRELDERSHEPIAIVGMACRYPGAVRSPEDLWRLVIAANDATSAFPTDRGWDLERLFNTDPDLPGSSRARAGGFLHDATEFDAAFFDISPREAQAMDPQQRLLLEVAWEAIEDAAINPRSLRGTKTAVVAGISSSEYDTGGRSQATQSLEGYGVTGNADSVISGRVSYTLGLLGPALTLNTACSSSLVALHLAAAALRTGECDLALAGGVTVLATPRVFVEFSRQRAVSPDGRCRSFAQGADGTGFAEGVGVLLLERLGDARRAGHRVLGLVRGSAVNQDGASNGLTAPSGASQRQVILTALAQAGATGGDIDAVEGHGTGTVLGDPIEIAALLETYGRERPADRPLWLGSIKSNIGHTQAAAGVAGVIKMVKAFEHSQLPASLFAQSPSRKVDWTSGSVRLLDQPRQWPRGGLARRAGVSSFGVSGTNAHIVLEEPPPDLLAPSTPPREPAVLAPQAAEESQITVWTLSARSAAALAEQASRLHEHLGANPQQSPCDVALSLAQRASFEHRAALVGTAQTLLKDLGRLARPAADPSTLDLIAPTTVEPDALGAGIVFVFSGQGSQWPGMACELIDTSPLFAGHLKACEQALAAHVDWSLEAVLRGAPGAPNLERVDVVQPALFAVMVSLAELWRAAGVRPAAVVGHSQGEIAAAHVAGALSLQDAARLVAMRSRALLDLVGQGAMVSLALSEQELQPWLERYAEKVALAAINSPRAVVVSVEAGSVADLLGELERAGIRAREIAVGYASHSPQIEQIREQLLSACAGVKPRAGEIPLFSSLTGRQLDTATMDAEYWYRNLRQPVRFADATQALLGQGFRGFVEVTAHPVLSAAVQESADAQPHESATIAAFGSLRRQDGGRERFLRSLCQAWTSGLDVDWDTVLNGQGARCVGLPSYPFQRKRYWVQAPGGETQSLLTAGLATEKHPLLGAFLALPDGEGWLFTGRLSDETHPWLSEHAVQGTTVLAGAALLELALYAARKTGFGLVQELTMQAPLILPSTGALQLQLRVQPVADGADESARGGRAVLTISSRPACAAAQCFAPEREAGREGEGEGARGVPPTAEPPALTEPRPPPGGRVSANPTLGGEEAFTRHAVGELCSSDAYRESALCAQVNGWPSPGAQPLCLKRAYEQLAETGYEYGPLFQGLQGAWREGDTLYVQASLPAQGHPEAQRFALHPALLDAVLHAAALRDPGPARDGSKEAISLPFSFENVELHAAGATDLRATLCFENPESLSLEIADSEGSPVISIGALHTRPLPLAQLTAPSAPERTPSLLRVDWTEVCIDASAPRAQPCALLGPSTEALFELLGVGGVAVNQYADLPALLEAIEGRTEPPRLVLADCRSQQPAEGDGVARAALAATHRALKLLQSWLGDDRLATTRLVLLSENAVCAGPGETLRGLANAPLWGLVRTAQSEAPGRVALIDLDEQPASMDALPGALGLRHEQLAIRCGVALAPRLEPWENTSALCPPAGTQAWRLSTTRRGTLENLAFLPAPEVDEPLTDRQVRIATRTIGLNFRDALIALDMYPGEALIGSEGAGVVVGVGSDVSDLAVGQRVAGLLNGGAGPRAVCDRRLLTAIPDGWSDVQAAALPVAFLTAHCALLDLADLRRGERVLVHAGAGAVGMAAVQIAQRAGAEVFATASPAKWHALRALGLEDSHIASSRSAQFKEQFLQVTANEGVNVVLNSLAGELADASLDLLPSGGRFVEIGKADVRDSELIGAEHPGVVYRTLDLAEVERERIQQLLGELFSGEPWPRMPVRCWDIAHSQKALRFLAQGHHIGKNVLRLPAPIKPDGTALITGGLGRLGAILAAHLVEAHAVRHLMLISRRGAATPGAGALKAELEQLGADVQILACDITKPEQLATAIDAIPTERSLSVVVHAAGALADATITSLKGADIDRVLAPKLAAWHLHELTERLDLQAFVLFSSVSGVLGGAGQGNYAAANTFLDALAAHRRSRGLAATSIAWGLWAESSELTRNLTGHDRARLARSGVGLLSTEHALEMFDRALAGEQALAVALEGAHALLASFQSENAPALRGATAPAGRAGLQSLARRIAGLADSERRSVVIDLVQAHAAAVLGHRSSQAISPRQAFKDLGFDSLASVELRNRLSAATGLLLPTTVAFDHPNPTALAEHLLEKVAATASAQGAANHSPATRPSPRASEEPIAIVGMGCRYPGGVNSPADLFELTLSATDTIADFPTDRGWDLNRLYHPDPGRPGTSYVRHGGFLEDAAQFDADFFGIGPREALAMDPQQRLLLEVASEALEDAHIDATSLRGSRSGVFAGISSQDYASNPANDALTELEGYLGTGLAGSVVSGRLAYTLGLEGPAITLDTACSSSLVALHLAVQSLRAGECSLALAGGVTVLCTPRLFVEFSRQRGLAPDGRCKSFAQAADGTGFSEGAGVLVLERVSDARRSGHKILALVRGGAVNQDGASNGLTAPNGPAQRRVIEQALASAALTPADVDAVEAHGTGTTLGDPIEAQALLETYGRERPPDRPLWLGSIKSNIGHAQAAAGVAGVIKMVMALRHGVLPSTLHVDEPTRKVQWLPGAIELLTKPTSWAPATRPRRAGVSGFGVSGTNAHLILEEAPRVQSNLSAQRADRPKPGSIAGGVVPWVLSARTDQALRAQARRLHERLAQASTSHHEVPASEAPDPSSVAAGRSPALESTGIDITDVGLSLSRRSAHRCRAVLLGEDRESLMRSLAALAQRDPAAMLASALASSEHGTAFLFTGQGAQRPGMGQELALAFPVFAGALGEICAELDLHLKRPLREVMWAKPGSPAAELLDQTAFTQASLFALEVALFRLLESWGLRPSVVAGHSIGELAAAHVAGAFNLKDACALVAARGELMGALPSGGAMASIQASEHEVLGTLEGFAGCACLAAINGPAATVVSGETQAISELVEIWERRGRKTRRLRVSHAFHSPRMDPMLEALAGAAAQVSFTEPAIALLCNVTGREIPASELCTAQYWVRQAREPVRFHDQLRRLGELGIGRTLELGPEGVLSALCREALGSDSESTTQGGDRARGVASACVLRRGAPEPLALTSAVAQMWTDGAQVSWSAPFEGSGASLVSLPAYPFERKRYWVHDRTGDGAGLTPGSAAIEHPLLSALVELAGSDHWLLSGEFSLRSQPWLADHVVLGTTLLPSTAFVELALQAGLAVGRPRLRELIVQAPLVLAGERATQIQVVVSQEDECGERTVEIHSRALESPTQPNTAQWTCNATGVLAEQCLQAAKDSLAAPPLAGITAPPRALPDAQSTSEEQWPPHGALAVELENCYPQLASLGFEYGDAFRGLRSLWRRGAEVFAEVALPDGESARAGQCAIHPALLDGALHGLVALADLFADAERSADLAAPNGTGPPAPSAQSSPQLRLPFAWNDLELHRRGARSLRVTLAAGEQDTVSLAIADEQGAALASVGAMTMRPVAREQLESLRDGRGHRPLFELQWNPADGADRSASTAGKEECHASQWAVLGALAPEAKSALIDAGVQLRAYPDLGALGADLAEGFAPPATVLALCDHRPSDLSMPNSALGGGEPDGALDCAADSLDLAGALRRDVHGALKLLQDWRSQPRLLESTLLLVTQQALATNPGERLEGLAQSAVWGLVRVAQSEFASSLVIVDVDGEVASWRALPDALAASEPQLALRRGAVFAPRLVALAPGSSGSAPRNPHDSSSAAAHGGRERFDPERTVLITGGTGALGALVSRHLVACHGVRSLLLASRRGPLADGAYELVCELEALGAQVRVEACNVSDRSALGVLIDSLAPGGELGGVVHIAGTLEDGVIDTITPAGLDGVLGAKAYAALHLHELTRGHDLSAFIMFSSAAGVIGAAGQGSYAAANTVLDALAAHRRAAGLVGRSLAWGPWEHNGGMTAGLGALDHLRIARLGVATLPQALALELLDRALEADPALLVLAHLDSVALGERMAAGTLPAILSGLVRKAALPPVAAASLAQRLAKAPEAEHERIVLNLVLVHVGAILGHPSAHAIDPLGSFKDSGFDSLGAVELRNRLSAATGLQLAPAVLFDFPTPTALASHLQSAVRGLPNDRPPPVEHELGALELTLSSTELDEAQRASVLLRLRALLAGLAGREEDGADADLALASEADVFDLIERELEAR